MNILAVCGFEGSGKDTVSNIIVEKYGYKRISFAGVLKDILAVLFDWDRELLEGITDESREWRETVDEWWSKELNIPNFTPRYAMQHIATDVLRKHFHTDIWLLAVKRKIMKMGKVIITDARFKNEIDFIKTLDGKLIHVYNEIPPWFEFYAAAETDTPFYEMENMHRSQYEWVRSKFDSKISNNSDLEDLRREVVRVYTELQNV